jgi:hypothetical protein
MNIFNFHNQIISDYKTYIESFIEKISSQEYTNIKVRYQKS